MNGLDWATVLGGIALGIGLNGLRQSTSRSPRSASAPPDRSDSPASQTQVSATDLPYWAAIEMAQFKAGFLARTSHELRSPLNGLISSLQLIQTDLCESPEEEREYVGIAYESALKLVGLLDEVIKVSKVQAGSQRLKPEAVDFNLMLDELHYLTHLQAANRNLKLRFDIPDRDISVWADADCLRHALTLVLDVLISVLPSGEIHLSLTLDQSAAIVTLQAPLPPEFWQETRDGLHASMPSPAPTRDRASPIPAQLSPQFRLLLAQELFAVNQTHFDLQEPPSRDSSHPWLLQCCLPLAPG